MANIGGEDFTATGLMVTERNWLVIYEPFERWTGRTIPEFFQGQEFVPSVLVVSFLVLLSCWQGAGGGGRGAGEKPWKRCNVKARFELRSTVGTGQSSPHLRCARRFSFTVCSLFMHRSNLCGWFSLDARTLRSFV